MMKSKALSGSGRRATAPLCERRWGGKECGPNPTARAKPGLKDHLLVDGRGVPLSMVVTAAHVNDGPTLPALLAGVVVERPRATLEAVQHLCLDAAYDNAPAHETVPTQQYQGHIAPRAGRAAELPRHPSGQARRWVAERTHAWHDRFRRLVVNWEKLTENRYAFLCLANPLMAYRA